MKTFVKCEMCNAEVPVDKCVFASHRRVIDGKEYIFCCVRCAEAFKRRKE
jgi:YHS domain-containing protein